ncbi:unnamed protein product [Rotaria sp. Silwood1]|nr:unnamed protein product [Rotaria sp. Silwood1]
MIWKWIVLKSNDFSTSTDSLPDSLAVGDFNRDQRQDIVVINSYEQYMQLFLGSGDGNFDFAMKRWATNTSALSSVAVADFDNDGRSDIVLTSFSDRVIIILLQYTHEAFSVERIYTMERPSLPAFVATAYLNNDQNVDIVVTYFTSDNIGIYYGFGHGTLAPVIKYSTGGDSYPSYLVLYDFNDDSRLDIAVVNSGANNIGIFLADENKLFPDPLMLSTGENSHPNSVALGDLNNDGYLDIVVANTDANTIRIMFRQRYELPTNSIELATGIDSQPCSIAINDFNSDNRLDIVVLQCGTSHVKLFLGHGDGSFLKQFNQSTGLYSYPSSLAIGDFNNDHHLDLAVTNAGTSNVAIFLGHNNGTFSDSDIYMLGFESNPVSVTIGDFNNDNLTDMVVANFGNNKVEILLKTC